MVCRDLCSKTHLTVNSVPPGASHLPSLGLSSLPNPRGWALLSNIFLLHPLCETEQPALLQPQPGRRGGGGGGGGAHSHILSTAEAESPAPARPCAGEGQVLCWGYWERGGAGWSLWIPAGAASSGEVVNRGSAGPQGGGEYGLGGGPERGPSPLPLPLQATCSTSPLPA